jgi:hypothetical protein
MLKALGPLAIKLYEGHQIQDLLSGSAEPIATGLDKIFKFLKKI